MEIDTNNETGFKKAISGIVGTIIVGALAACTTSEGQFVVKNNATEIIATVSVVICGQTERFAKIGVQQTRTAKYRVTSDSHYHVEVDFQSGRKLERNVGYVTNGMRFDDELIISDADIEIANKNRN